MERWCGKVAIVTGASSGIGEAIAATLTKAGMKVVGLARRVNRVEEKAAQLAQSKAKGKLYAVQCDMRKEDDILAAFAWTTKNVGPVHVLVNNAGLATQGSLTSGSTEDWRKTIETNVLGLCIATREASKIMMAEKIEGHIVHINSVCGQVHMYLPNFNVYGATKHAVTNLTEMLRQEMVALKTNIKVTSISPGMVDTEAVPDEMKALVGDMTLLRADDIADAVVYVLGVPQRVHINELTIRPTNSAM